MKTGKKASVPCLSYWPAYSAARPGERAVFHRMLLHGLRSPHAKAGSRIHRRGFFRRLSSKVNPREALIQSTCSDLRQKFSLARKKSAGILCVFQTFLTKISGDLYREDGCGDLFRDSQDFLFPFEWQFSCIKGRFPADNTEEK